MLFFPITMETALVTNRRGKWWTMRKSCVNCWGNSSLNGHKSRQWVPLFIHSLRQNQEKCLMAPSSLVWTGPHGGSGTSCTLVNTVISLAPVSEWRWWNLIYVVSRGGWWEAHDLNRLFLLQNNLVEMICEDLNWISWDELTSKRQKLQLKGV